MKNNNGVLLVVGCGLLVEMVKEEKVNRGMDWLRQAKRDFEKAQLDFEYAYYEWCCFTAQQASEKAVKAFIYGLKRSVRGHSISKMLEGLQGSVEVPDDLLHYGKVLDRYYVEGRYPNGFPEGSPFEFFDEKMAEEAINAARALLRFCEDHISRL